MACILTVINIILTVLTLLLESRSEGPRATWTIKRSTNKQTNKQTNDLGLEGKWFFSVFLLCLKNGKNTQNRQILDGDFTRENLWLWKSRIPSWERQNKSTLVAGFNHFEICSAFLWSNFRAFQGEKNPQKQHLNEMKPPKDLARDFWGR